VCIVTAGAAIILLSIYHFRIQDRIYGQRPYRQILTEPSERSLPCHYRSLEVPLPAERQRDVQQHYQTPHAPGSTQRPLAPLPFIQENTSPSPHQPDNQQFPINPGHYQRSRDGRSAHPTNLAAHLSEQDVEAGPGSFGEANRHTQGTEPYPSGIYSLLLKLRSRTGKQNPRAEETRIETPKGDGNSRDLSIGSLLRPTQTDSPIPYSTTIEQERKVSHHIPSPSPTFNVSKRWSPSTTSTPGPAAGSSTLLSNSDIEKECVRLYFSNLHLVHPILDQAKFTARCETEIWDLESQSKATSSTFLALFNAVVAIGAINAGDDATFMRDIATVRQTERFAGPDQRAPTYPPLKLAKLFFERAKINLGDVFETCSLESTQTFVLMVRLVFSLVLQSSDSSRLYFAKMRSNPIAVICTAGWP
jgi:hypothetical protein